jgi:arylsulfatase A-like enzyme
MDDGEVTLAETLSQEGYEPVAVVPNRYFTRARWGSITAGFKRVIESPALSSKRHNSAEVTDAALSALSHSDKRPLFLWAHYFDAHSPHAQPKQAPVFGSRTSDLYDAELAHVDREVGRLLDAIEQQLGGQALVIVSADHGIAFDAPRHSRFNYGYDLSTAVLHVPLVMHAAWIEPRLVDQVVSTMDIAPTVANLVRVRRHPPFEGASLLPELLRGETTRPQRLLHELYLPERLAEQEDPLEVISLRTDRYNLVHDRRIGTYELYDWRADYFELQDLADRPQHRATFLALKQQLAYLTYQMHLITPPHTAAVTPR